MLDTKGPEIRTGKLKEKTAKLEAGKTFYFTTDQSFVGDDKMVAISYMELPLNVLPGHVILVDDGNLQFKVIESDHKSLITTTILNGGVLKETKGVNIPGADLRHLPAVSEKDISDILFGVKNDIDFIAASFINRKSDVEMIRNIPG